MSKSLAEMRASEHTGLPERSKEMCLSQKLVAEVQQLDAEERDLRVAEFGETDGAKKPRRTGQGKPKRLDEIAARKQELSDLMREHTGTLLVRAVDGGEWSRWKDQHPARVTGNDESGKPILNTTDVEVAYGYCNAADLLESLSDYAVSWNGEPLGVGEWEFVASKAAPGDLKELCGLIVQMQEGPGARPFLPRPSSTTQGTASASSSPAA